MDKYYSKMVSDFDKKASTYELLHVQEDSVMGLNERLRRSSIEILIDGFGKLLSIGCGTGWCLEKFAGRFLCFGIDLSFEMLKQCKTKDLHVCLANAEVLPVKGKQFDCVLCINMFQYPENPSKVLWEINRVIKEGGVLIFDFKNRHSWRAMAHYWNRMFRESHTSDIEKRYAFSEVRKLLQDAGFKIQKLAGTEFHWLPVSNHARSRKLISILEKIERLLATTPLKYFAGRIFILARPINPFI